jgi:DNA-binding transcriptional LysR family regulator
MDRHVQLRSFVLIAEKGGFAAAAAVEGVTPVVMGRRLSALEDRLGVRLMHRSTRGLRLTEVGSEFLGRCRETLRDFEELEQSIASSRRAVSGRLVVSAPAGFGRRHVAAHAPDFLKAYPGVQLTLHLTDALVDLVRDRIDVAIRIGPVSDANLVVARLAANRRVVCGSPDYLARHGTPMTPEDLLNHNCLTLAASSGQQGGWTFRRGDDVAAVQVAGTLACSDGELLTEWMIAGLGLGWRSTWEVQAALAGGTLVSVLDEYAVGDYPIQAIYPAQRYVPAKVHAFIEFLREQYARPRQGNGMSCSVDNEWADRASPEPGSLSPMVG